MLCYVSINAAKKMEKLHKIYGEIALNVDR